MADHICRQARSATGAFDDVGDEYGIEMDTRQMAELGAIKIQPPTLEFGGQRTEMATDRQQAGNYSLRSKKFYEEWIK